MTTSIQKLLDIDIEYIEKAKEREIKIKITLEEKNRLEDLVWIKSNRIK